MIKQESTIESLSFLYELSLATGKTLDFIQNSNNFLTVLMPSKKLVFASIWLTNRFLENQDVEKGLNLVFAKPTDKLQETQITTSHTIWNRLQKDKVFSITPTDKDFSEYVQEQVDPTGVYAFYALDGIGFLKTYSLEQKEHYQEADFLQLQDVIAKFTISTKACFIHSKLQTAKAVQEIEQLRRKRLLEELEFTNQELKDFAYIVSHDLKAPLRAIHSLASWLEDDYADVLDEMGLEQLQLLQSRAVRMHNFIEGILEYSRIGRVKEQWVKVNLSESIKNIIDMLNPAEYIQIEIPEVLPTVYGEKVRIEQVFLNLISNSIKYNDKESPIISINWQEKNNRYYFEIEDNGQGIKEKHFNKIFQIFQTLQSRDAIESTGIGLTIVKKVVELHNGKISVKSEYGIGTTMAFSFPKFK